MLHTITETATWKYVMIKRFKHLERSLYAQDQWMREEAVEWIVEHSATNYPQYDQYAFPPNMAATLHDKPDRSALNLDHAMPTGSEMFSAILVMKILSLVLTNSLGNYKSSYFKSMDNEGRSFVRNFQKNLAVIQEEINQRNAAIIASNEESDVQEYPYEWLLPEKVLNSISI